MHTEPKARTLEPQKPSFDYLTQAHAVCPSRKIPKTLSAIAHIMCSKRTLCAFLISHSAPGVLKNVFPDHLLNHKSIRTANLQIIPNEFYHKSSITELRTFTWIEYLPFQLVLLE